MFSASQGEPKLYPLQNLKAHKQGRKFFVLILTLDTHRFTVAALAFWPYLSKADKDVWASGAEIGLWAAIGYLAQAQGLLTTEASHAAFISTLTVIVVPVLAGLTGKHNHDLLNMKQACCSHYGV